MSAKGAHKITEQFEKELAKYTGAPYCVCVDNASNAIFLTLYYQQVEYSVISIPKYTYPSVPCEIIHAGAEVKFIGHPSIKAVRNDKAEGLLSGAYRLGETKTWDSALRFTSQMYIPKSFMCLSFTGPYKRLKLGKGGAILTDNVRAYNFFKRVRFSGRRECSYFEDKLDMLGWNMYMMPELSAKGISLMPQFYELDGTPRDFPDLELWYPDLSNFSVY